MCVGKCKYVSAYAQNQTHSYRFFSPTYSNWITWILNSFSKLWTHSQMIYRSYHAFMYYFTYKQFGYYNLHRLDNPDQSEQMYD